MTINDFLMDLGMEQYISKFEEEAIEYDMLNRFSENDFRSIGMKLGHIKKLVSAIESINKKEPLFQKQSIILSHATEFPSVISVPLFEYFEESNPKLRLWDICDFIELSLRLVVITGLAQIQKDKGKIPKRVVTEIRARIEHPTLGKWLGMALAIASDTSVSKKVKELASIINKELKGQDHQDERNSLLSLRNFLAHGGSVSQKLAYQLLEIWELRFEQLIQQLHWFTKFQVIIRDGTGYKSLKGALNTHHSYEPCSDEETQVLKNLITNANNVVLKLDNEYLPLWPLFFYENSSGDYLNPVQNIFVRRGELFLEYTPVGSLDQCQSQSDKDALHSFIQLFQLENHKKLEYEKKFLVRSFENEFLSDAKRFVGRVTHLSQIKDAIHKENHHVFWITGNAGIGKSYLISATTVDYIERNDPLLLTLSYRFKAGDDRCYRSEFIKFSVERLNQWGGTITIDKQPSTYNIQDLLKLLENIHVDWSVLFILDGFDELPLVDQILANEICEELSLPRTKWLCSGRTNPKLNDVFSKSAYNIFPNGVPGMEKSDIQSMIYEKIGPLRKKVIIREYEKDNLVINPFIEQVWSYSKGIPLYVTYVIGDILSNRIQSFDGTTDQLPPSIFHYHQELVKRCSVGLYQQILPRLIATIAIAKESLTQETLQDILIKENYLPPTEKAKEIMHKCLTYVSPMLRKVSSNRQISEGFILYHTSLREFLSEDEESKILLYTARKSLINLIDKQLGNKSEADIYLLKWGIVHLLEDDESHEDLLISLLGNSHYLQEKFYHQRLEYLFDDLYEGFLSLKNKSAHANILEAFLTLVVNNIDHTGTHLTIENVHALLVYRQNESFYESFLNFALEKYNSSVKGDGNHSYKKLYPSFLLRKANLSRRKGRIGESQRLLEKALELFISEGNMEEIEKLEYDLAYVQYLQGNIEEAFNHFEKSKQYAISNEHEVGYWISHCVQAHALQFDAKHPLSQEELITILKQALPIFVRYAKVGEENAKRWVKNVHQHTFMAAFETKNLLLAEECYEKMANNEWIQKFDKGNLNKYKARLYWLREEKEKAAQVFSSYLDQELMEGESIAREYLLYSLLLKELGNDKKSMKMAEIGQSCPPQFGNSFFQGLHM